MSVIALHPHADVGWVSWNRGRAGFGAIHLARPSNSLETLCGAAVPIVGRVVRNQETAAIEDLCKSCLKEYATRNREG